MLATFPGARQAACSPLTSLRPRPMLAESPLACLVSRQGERLVCMDLAPRWWAWSHWWLSELEEFEGL